MRLVQGEFALHRDMEGGKRRGIDVKGTDGPDECRKMAAPQPQRSLFGCLRGFRI